MCDFHLLQFVFYGNLKVLCIIGLIIWCCLKEGTVFLRTALATLLTPQRGALRLGLTVSNVCLYKRQLLKQSGVDSLLAVSNSAKASAVNGLERESLGGSSVSGATGGVSACTGNGSDGSALGPGSTCDGFAGSTDLSFSIVWAWWIRAIARKC